MNYLNVCSFWASSFFFLSSRVEDINLHRNSLLMKSVFGINNRNDLALLIAAFLNNGQKKGKEKENQFIH